MKTASKSREVLFYTLVGILAITVFATAACEDLEVADYNSRIPTCPHHRTSTNSRNRSYHRRRSYHSTIRRFQAGTHRRDI